MASHYHKRFRENPTRTAKYMILHDIMTADQTQALVFDGCDKLRPRAPEDEDQVDVPEKGASDQTNEDTEEPEDAKSVHGIGVEKLDGLDPAEEHDYHLARVKELSGGKNETSDSV